MHKLCRNTELNFICTDTRGDCMPLPSAREIETNNYFNILFVLSLSQDFEKTMDL